ncbi:hypothetical protein GH5_05272 [Leishmania sp. Ghana 2012 LV757]|uniref:hypothetical protein n=1 Tax=Leishmania sp. Ghana 2012 LV757 TaxID=2803181 RepID=UPI001B5479B6|nr:hypothetical protein GH5_05272 [Leishmania sp. Ghana 2012 LV757]
MDFARTVAERAASSAPSPSLFAATQPLSIVSARVQTPAREALQQASTFLGNGHTAPKALSSADMSSGQVVCRLSPSLSSQLFMLHGHDTGMLHAKGAAPTPQQDAGSTRRSCGSVRSSSTSAATPSRGASGSSGGLTRTSGGDAATCLSSTSAHQALSEAALENEQSLTRCCCITSLDADPQPTFSPSRAHHGTMPPSASSSSAHSPDAQPPTPASSPFLSPSVRALPTPLTHQYERVQQEQSKPQHVRFSQPIAAQKRSASASVYPARTSPSAKPPSQVSAADQTAVKLLRGLSFAEVQEAQDCFARGASPKVVWAVSSSIPLVRRGEAIIADPGNHESVSSAAALLGAAPASLDVAANLYFSQLFRASLMGDGGDDELSGGGECAAVVGGSGGSKAAADGGETPRAGEVRGGTGPTPLWGETLPRSSEDGDAYSSPSSHDGSGWDGACPDVEVENRYEDDLTVSSITCVSPPTPPPHRTSADAAPLLGPYSFLSPSPSQNSAVQPLVWPASPPYAEGSFSTPPQRPLSPPIVATRWSLSDFDIGRRIGQGHTGKTFLVREKHSSVVMALKVFDDYVDLHQGEASVLKRGMRLQAAAGRHCPHIVKLYAFFTDARRRYAALELADGGDLASHLSRQPHQRLPEAQVQSIVQHVALALRHLHEQRVVHRAVTLRNVLLRRGEGGTTVKLGDFASAVQLARGRARWLDGLGGACDGRRWLDYAAPEVIRGEGWSCKSDLWALGVLAFQLLCGHHPFDHVSEAEMKRLICSGVVCRSPHALSHTGKSFVQSLLCVNEAARSSAATALAHPFLSAGAAATAAAAVSAMRSAATNVRAESARAAAPAAPAGAAARGELRLNAVPLPVSRDLSRTFSLVAMLANAGTNCSNARGDSCTSAATSAGTRTPVSCAEAAPSSPPSADDIQCARNDESISVHSRATTSLSPSVAPLSTTKVVTGTGMRVQDAVRRRAGAATPAAPAISPTPFMSFALPTHPWQNTALPPSMTLSVASLSGPLCNEETGTRSGRRPSTASLRSAENASRHSPTTTLSDMSVSFLSTTRAPATLTLGAATATVSALSDSAAVESVLSANFKDSSAHYARHRRLKQQRIRCGQQHEQPEASAAYVGVGTARSSEGRRSEDLLGDCSVTLSSLTPHPSRGARTEWATDDADVSVSSSTTSSTSFFSMSAKARQTSVST